MTPYEKAIKEAEKINYCDECQNFAIVGSAAYCKVDGKMLHPLMYQRGQGSGPAYRCENARRKNVSLIDLGLAEKAMREVMKDEPSACANAQYFINVLRSLPPANYRLDGEPVVICAVCKHRGKRQGCIRRRPDWFCADGERWEWSAT